MIYYADSDFESSSSLDGKGKKSPTSCWGGNKAHNGFDKPTFGSRCQRFGINYAHPKMWTPQTNAAFERCCKNSSHGSELSPAYYNIRRLWELDAKAQVDSDHGWTKQKVMEELAKLPSIVMRDLFENKRELQRRLGPGKYDICTEPKKPQGTKAPMDVRSTRSKKFASRKLCTPGPGTYGKGGVPFPRLGEKKQVGTVSYLEKRVCDRSLGNEGSGIPPNAYVFKDGLQMLLEKTVGKRGPYDISTGERDEPIKAGHRARVVSCLQREPNYKVTEDCLSRLCDRWNKKKGEWGRGKQYPTHSGERVMYTVLPVPPKDAIKPGPGYYNIASPLKIAGEKELQKIKTMEEKNPYYGFLRGSKRAMTFQRVSSKVPGPGRYEVRRFAPEGAKMPTAIFKGGARPLDPRKHMMFRERLRTTNLGLQYRINYLFSHLG